MKREKIKIKITRVVKSGCICSAAEDLSSSFLVGEADSRREQDKERSWSGLRIPRACLGQQRVQLQGNLSTEARAGDGVVARGGSWSSVSNTQICTLTEGGKHKISPAEVILKP